MDPLATLMAATLVRVGLADGAREIAFGVASASLLVDATGATASIRAGEVWWARPDGNMLVISLATVSETVSVGVGVAVGVAVSAPASASASASGSAAGSATAPYSASATAAVPTSASISAAATATAHTLSPPVRLIPNPATPVFIGKKWYRGALELRLSPEGRVTAVNELPLDEYLFGVVPGEMPPTWPPEGLKAQAVAARTYTASRLGSRRDRGYDVKPTVEDQVYGGLSIEATASTRAVAESAGLILVYGGAPINAFYCAGAGGFTEGAESVQGFERKEPGKRPGGYPYLMPVPDFDWDSPRWHWQVGLAESDLRAKLARKGVSVGPIRSVEITERTYSGRARWV
ncbi:MAG: SpoIID/LytB domain-containing protein, partial [Candidatus Sericytochromatia bacterium]|nr:SpoIID/LytB domain-containing protein [Candidatus Tanganyikabacteria bacterium]